MNQLLLSLVFMLMFGIECLGQSKLAIIKDKEGYTYIQSSQGTDFTIVAEIKSNVFFYCDKPIGDYYPVTATQWGEINENYGKQVKGIIHKSHVQLLEALPFSEQKKIISNVFRDYRNMIDPSYSNSKNADSSNTSKQPLEVSFFYEVKYELMLDFFKNYYCKTKDTETLGLLFSTMWSDKNTANEVPGIIIGECYLCNEQLYLNEFHRIKDPAKLEYIKGQTNWGLFRHFDIDPESEKITNREFLRLSNQLEIK